MPNPTAPSADKTPLATIVLTGAICVATMIQSLDGTIANVALPHVQGSMSASLDQVTWVLTSYAVAAAIATPLSSFLTLRYGRKNVLLAAVSAFTAASMLCGASQSLEQIVIFRLLQGFSGGFLIPVSQSALMTIYPREKHSTVLAVWSAGVTMAPMLGPTLGGYLTEVYSWRWAFYINLPLGFLAGLGIFTLMDESDRNVTARFDLTGFLLITMAFSSLQMTLDRGTMLDWFSSKEIFAEATLAVLAFYAFVIHILTAEHPFINRDLFKNQNFVVGMLLGFLYILMLFGSTAILPTMLQSLMGYPVFTTGMLLMPRGLGSILAMVMSTFLTRRIDPRYIVFVGICATAGAMFHVSHFTLDVGENEIMLNGVLQGFGVSLVFQPLTALAFATIEPRFFSEAASIFGLVRSLGSSIGISLMATFVTRFTQINHSNLAEHVTPYNHAIGAAVGVMGTVSAEGAQLIDAMINRQATMIAYLDSFRMMLYVIIAGAFLVPLIRVPKKSQPVDELVIEM